MVSLSEDTSRRTFFDDNRREEDDFLTESSTLSLVANTEQKRQTINTTWVIVLEIMLLVTVWVCCFILPPLCTPEKCVLSSFSLVLYVVVAVWFLQVIIDRIYRNQHYRNRLYGYLNFYRQTRNIRRLPLLIASAALAFLLLATQLISYYCPDVGDSEKCGPVYRDGYLQMIISVSCAIQILLLVVYSIRTIQFNRSGASPDVNQEEMMTSFLQTNSTNSDIGFRDGSLLDQVLEKQADMIRYLKQHNEQLSRKLISLGEENEQLQQRLK